MAAGDILIRAGADIVFGSEPGDDVAWTTEGVIDGAGRESAQHDLGDPATAARTNRYRVRSYTQFQATPVVNQSLDLYLKTSDGTNPDNNTGAIDAAVTAEDKLLNLQWIGSIVVDEAAAAVAMALAVDEIIINHRYVQMVLWNNSGASLSATASATKLILTPIIYQGQAS